MYVVPQVLVRGLDNHKVNSYRLLSLLSLLLMHITARLYEVHHVVVYSWSTLEQ